MSMNINTGPDRLLVFDFGVLRKVCSHALNAKPKTGCHSFKYVFLFFFKVCLFEEHKCGLLRVIGGHVQSAYGWNRDEDTEEYSKHKTIACYYANTG